MYSIIYRTTINGIVNEVLTYTLSVGVAAAGLDLKRLIRTTGARCKKKKVVCKSLHLVIPYPPPPPSSPPPLGVQTTYHMPITYGPDLHKTTLLPCCCQRRSTCIKLCHPFFIRELPSVIERSTTTRHSTPRLLQGLRQGCRFCMCMCM